MLYGVTNMLCNTLKQCAVGSGVQVSIDEKGWDGVNFPEVTRTVCGVTSQQDYNLLLLYAYFISDSRIHVAYLTLCTIPVF